MIDLKRDLLTITVIFLLALALGFAVRGPLQERGFGSLQSDWGGIGSLLRAQAAKIGIELSAADAYYWVTMFPLIVAVVDSALTVAHRAVHAGVRARSAVVFPTVRD